MTTKRLVAIALLAVCAGAIACHAADSLAVSRYIPEVHGTFRGVYQLSTANGQSRFAVQNARVAVGGSVFAFLDYFAQIDLCANGRINFLDAYGRLKPARGLSIFVGQMRVPSDLQASPAPAAYRFVDASLSAQFGYLRSAGVKAGYDFGVKGLYAEGGVFNATDKADHTTWNSALTYGAKLSYNAAGWHPEVAFMSRQPGGRGRGVRINQWNASLSWTCGGFTAHADYIRLFYTTSALSPTDAWSVWVDYGVPVRSRLANRISAQARFDGLTAASSGLLGADGRPVADIAAQRRLTVGLTSSYIYKKAHFDFRINYEQYFYSKGVENISPSANNKLSAGVVFYF